MNEIEKRLYILEVQVAVLCVIGFALILSSMWESGGQPQALCSCGRPVRPGDGIIHQDATTARGIPLQVVPLHGTP